jgi:hypothetical protein
VIETRLLVLGGFGRSGMMASGFGNPKIENCANNDGCFDDTSNGAVTATFQDTQLNPRRPTGAGRAWPSIASFTEKASRLYKQERSAFSDCA